MVTWYRSDSDTMTKAVLVVIAGTAVVLASAKDGEGDQSNV